jgi:hypothetical protein
VTYNGETQQFFLSERAIIIQRAATTKKSARNPAGIDFSVTGRIRKADQFQDVIRVDNKPHLPGGGAHGHFFDKPKHKGQVQVTALPDVVNPEQAFHFVEEHIKKRYPELLE